ncbi:excisionase [Comamonas testosteroni]|uniref:excisionase n=1 Tax=Comamonas testosteroni TaxID=285 RepID=UPI0023AAEF81|nr:excisionase [Comamonas testosteroni]WEE79385.1 excisionase [Comamonas testosteroni]
MKHQVTEVSEAAANDELAVAPEWVLASKFEELTGVTKETVKQRKKAGIWREGAQVAVVKRRLYVNIKAADQWIKDHLPKQHRPA